MDRDMIGQNIYWRFIGNKGWNVDMVKALPAEGLVDLRENQYSIAKNIVSLNEIEWKHGEQPK